MTPQWVGEEGVDAVVLLSIDDMNDIGRYEAWLRPVLECLKEDGGRAPLSILTNSVDPTHKHLQKWLDEGITIEVHTVDHPCPLLQEGGLASARSTYERCVDMVGSIPGNQPVGFRMPCCDSINSVSPRFFSEIFSRKTAAGRFLTVDSSVFNVFTADDPALPLEVVEDRTGRPRFAKYLPRDRSFVNTIENYPYPYVIGRVAWEFPCVVPSDWEAQHLHGPNKSETVIDLLAAINATVIKQGLFTFVFHPHGWIRNDQVINIIRQTRAQFGKRVRFLSMRDVQERLDHNLLMGEPLRRPDGSDNGVRILDVDGDGYQDVVIGNERVRRTRRWSPDTRRFEESEFPVVVDPGARFGIVDSSGHAALIVRNEVVQGGWRFDGERWIEAEGMLRGLDIDEQPVLTSEKGRDRGARLRDIDGDGVCEFVIGNPEQTAVFNWSPEQREWQRRPYTLPEGAVIVDAKGDDAGLRFVDVNEDGRLDVLFSNAARWSLHLFTSSERGWSQEVTAGSDGATRGLPAFVRDGTDSGAWFHSGHLWTQNEGTAAMANHVDRRAFADLLAPIDPPERTTEQAIHALHPRPGLRVELVAAEPLIRDPIAFDWGPDGRLWVVEMGDYPLGDPDAVDGGGRVRFLRDEDGDGRYDTSTVFKDGLSFPTGVMAWRDGVLICCPPDVLYAEDRDGDGRADHQVILFDGFGTGNQQHRANGFRWGLDNHVYGANGDSGGRIRSVATGAVIDISGRDFRMLPDAGVLDPQSGATQFGRSRDDWGNWFGGNNSNPLWHFVLADHYLRRNPHVAARTARVAVPEQAGKARVFPRMPVPTRFNTPSDASRLTSACSFAVYRDTLLGPAFSGDLFFCEPSHGLVHRQAPSPSGVTFTSRRAPGEEDTEFLASSDPWFRPTMVRTGPDGALWISDMARLVIEHPEWIPDDWEKQLDLRAGKDRGRIYRVLPIRGQPRAVPRFDALDGDGLVDVLESPNGVQRDIAHRLLVHRRDLSVAPRLARMTREAERPTARLHALCALDGLGALNAEHVRAALDDVHPGVRRHAVRLCEGRLNDAPQLVATLVARVDDDAPQVRLQLACTLGACDDPRAALALARLAWRDHGDPFLRAAILSSLGRENLATVLDGLERLADGADIPVALLAPLGQTAVGVGLATQAARVLEQLLESGDSAANRPLLTLLDAMDRAGMAAASDGPLAEHLASARTALVDNAAPTARRVRAMALIGREAANRTDDLKTLAGLLAPRSPGALQEAAARRLAALGAPHLPDLLVAGWRGHGPGLRATILDLLLQRPEWAQAIVDAVAAGTVRAREIDAARRPVLLRRLPEAARERAARLLERGAPTKRKDVVASWRGRIDGLVGDSARGRDVFAKTCGSCHALGGVGRGIGPDLGTLADRSTSTLLVAILDPNRAVEARYLSYDAWTHDGDVHTGLITEESGSSIKLVDLQGNEVNLLRKDIDELRSSGSSQMPEGLEKDLSAEQLADLLAFVRSRPPPRRRFVGNEPRPITPRPSDGALALTAARAEIYGASLRYEGTYGNLGFWSGLDDHATWTIDLPAAGTYELQLDYACADGTAGNHVVVSSGDQRVTSKVAGTGTWDDYRTTGIGRMHLPAGRSRLSVFAAKPLRQYLFDLRAVHLVPVGR